MEPGECKRGCKNKRVPERICAGKQAGKEETEAIVYEMTTEDREERKERIFDFRGKGDVV